MLLESKHYDGLTSDILLPTIKEFVAKGVKYFLYTSGPGSHMSTKICYTLLKSVEIIKDIPFDAISAFDLNSNQPIKALGKLYFVKEKENIITKKFQEHQENNFCFPDSLESLKILQSNEPEYHIDAVVAY